MKMPQWCKDCGEYDKTERECIIGPTKPFRKACKSFKEKAA